MELQYKLTYLLTPKNVNHNQKARGLNCDIVYKRSQSIQLRERENNTIKITRCSNTKL